MVKIGVLGGFFSVRIGWLFVGRALPVSGSDGWMDGWSGFQGATEWRVRIWDVSVLVIWSYRGHFLFLVLRLGKAGLVDGGIQVTTG